MNAENNSLKGYKLTELPEEISLQDFYDKSVISPEDYDKYFVLNNEALKECGLGELVNKYDGYFIVNYDDFEVIYTKGYENVNGLECYKLSELNKFNNPVNMDTVEASAGVADNVENSEEQAQTENQENTQGNVEENASESNAQNNENNEKTEVVHCENVFIKMVKEKFPQKSLVVDIGE